MRRINTKKESFQSKSLINNDLEKNEKMRKKSRLKKKNNNVCVILKLQKIIKSLELKVLCNVVVHIP